LSNFNIIFKRKLQILITTRSYLSKYHHVLAVTCIAILLSNTSGSNRPFVTIAREYKFQ